MWSVDGVVLISTKRSTETRNCVGIELAYYYFYSSVYFSMLPPTGNGVLKSKL